jgi:alkanesulfonate monooxygenase SsuD/methylene tetrahydromethanopterin reductase-like flavin-dependent oxidoreductase (luciferase family)
MEIGVSLPSMAKGYSGELLRAWCVGIDEGPYSSISVGERITFVNPELITTLAASAALTDRVRVFANLVVAPLHSVAMLAKQLATIDVLSEGRVIVGLGVGGRPHDYEAAGRPFTQRHQRVDDVAVELRSLWSGTPPFPGADPVGPPPAQVGGPKLLAGAMGAKSMRRATKWADGVTGFSLTGTYDEMWRQAEMARATWADAAPGSTPWLGTGTFCVVGVDEARSTLQEFGFDYLSFFGEETARAIAGALTIDSATALARVLDDAASCGVDEFTLVPGTWDLRCLGAMTDVVNEWKKERG